MIPFARIVKYGNSASGLNNRFKIYSASTAFYIHDLSTNKLYVSSYSKVTSGTGNIESKFVLCAQDVKRVMLERNSSSLCIYESIDGNYYALGSTEPMSGNATEAYSTWTNITSFIRSAGLEPDEIAFMSAFYNLKINLVSTTGSLYCSGYNNTTGLSSFGDGTNTPANNTLRRITSISSVKMAVGNYYVLTDGRLYCTGNNSLYQFGDNTLTSITGLKLIATDVNMVEAGYQNMYYLNNARQVVGSGTQFGSRYGNEFGTGGSSTSSPTVYSQGTILINNVDNLFACVGNMATHIVRDNTLYSTGNNTLSQFGVGDLTPRYSYTQSISDVEEGYQFVRCNLGSLYMSATGKLYYAGRGDLVVGTGETQYSYYFTEVPMDFIE